MLNFARPFVGIALFVGALTPFVLPSEPATSAPLVSTDPILEIHADALTTYLPSSSTPVQGVRPIVGQRGVNLDGMLRGAPSFEMAIHGNSFEDVWSAPAMNGMRLDTGTFAMAEVDIALPAEGFSWVIGRTHNARQQSGGSSQDSDKYQGANWFQTSQPEILFYDHATDNAKDMVYLVYGADRYVEFKRYNSTASIFKGTNGTAGMILFTAASGSEPEKYTLTEQHGFEFTFLGFDTNARSAAGQLWKIKDPDGNVAYVGNSSSAASAINYPTYGVGYNSDGSLKTAYDTSGRRFTYTYTTLDSKSRLTQVLAERNTGSWVTVGKVDYSYYSNESNGDIGDLKHVTVTTPLTDSGVELVQKKYFRYYEGTYGTTNRGYPHQIKYVVGFEGVRRFDFTDSTFDDDHLTALDASLAPYASAYFEYEDDGAGGTRRITKAWFNGECGCTGAPFNGTYEFTYGTNGSFSDNTSAYDSGWKTRTVVKRPDLSYLTQYWDEAHQPLSQVITDADPANTSPAPLRWATSIARTSTGMVDYMRTPTNCTGYTHSTGTITTSTTSGLVFDFGRVSSGAMKGFLNKRQFRKGSLGTAYYEKEWAYTQQDLEIGTSTGIYCVRPVLDKVHDYQVEGTTTANRITTEHNVTFHSGTLAIEDDEMVEPAISTSKNGSGTANDADPFYRKDGTPGFSKARDGVITYEQYTDGLLTKRIEDVDTTKTGDFGGESVPGAVGSTSGTIHRITTFAYDNQGRSDLTTFPDGRKIKRYYSRLADRRQVVLEYNDYATSPSTKFYGPVRYTIVNQAGKVEASGVISLTSNESTSALTTHVDEADADLITAIDLGTVARLSTQLFNESGTLLEERRLYFTVPASGAGDATNNYDPTFLGYDDMGRQDRVKEAHGTIRSRVYDDLGRVVSLWMGTNDAEETGTDDMVMIESREYDGGADNGNSYLTKRILFVQDSATDQRLTAYSNDLRGRMLL